MDVEKRGNGGDSNVRRMKKNGGDLGVLESRSKFEYEEKVIRSKEGGMRRKGGGRRKQERGVLLRRENVRMTAKEEERDAELRESLSERVRKEERENLLRENQRERARAEEKEDLFTREDNRRRVRKDGSSCSSYYSLSSGEFEIDNDVQGEQEEFEGELSGGCTRDSRGNGGLVSDEVREGFHSHGNYAKEQGVFLRKENAQVGFSGASSAVENDWRKKSEKRLTDVSIDKTKSSKELAQKQSRYEEVQGSGYGKTVGSHSRFDNKNKQSTLAVSFDTGTRERHRQTYESEARIKSKQFIEMSESRAADIKTSSTSHKLSCSRDESYAKSISSIRKQTDHHIAACLSSREDEYRRNSSKLAETSNIQEMDIRGTSTAARQSEIRIKNQEDYSNTNLTSVTNREEQLHQAGQARRLLDSRGKYHQVTQNVDSESTSVSKRESEIRMRKQEMDSSSIYKSNLEFRDHSEMTMKKNTGISVKDVGNKRTGVVTNPSSQLVARGSSVSRSATEGTSDNRLHGGFTASHQHSLDKSQISDHQRLYEGRTVEVYEEPLTFCIP
ncbi:hypothetical protein ACH5RR_036066 [Cinchona calisaya]|uniref:Uncharacterized protein n=1 Tax=Cinchona calisaya TaxID=153742 RepID=A0ABD2Y6V8_9GENT